LYKTKNHTALSKPIGLLFFQQEINYEMIIIHVHHTKKIVGLTFFFIALSEQMEIDLKNTDIIKKISLLNTH